MGSEHSNIREALRALPGTTSALSAVCHNVYCPRSHGRVRTSEPAPVSPHCFLWQGLKSCRCGPSPHFHQHLTQGLTRGLSGHLGGTAPSFVVWLLHKGLRIYSKPCLDSVSGEESGDFVGRSACSHSFSHSPNIFQHLVCATTVPNAVGINWEGSAPASQSHCWAAGEVTSPQPLPEGPPGLLLAPPDQVPSRPPAGTSNSLGAFLLDVESKLSCSEPSTLWRRVAFRLRLP